MRRGRGSAVEAPISLDAVEWSDYDFIDFGSSSGGSLEHCKRRFGAHRGMGIDTDPTKADIARGNGLAVVLADATQLEVDKSVRFASMLDFLEHLPDLAAVEAAILAATRAATDFVYIKHPSFEGQPYLGSLDLAQYWWQWTGHRCHITVADFHAMFARLGLTDYIVRYEQQITDSDHPSIVPADGPRNSHEYDPASHPPKPYVRFSEPVWRLQEIFIALRAIGPSEWQAITG